MDMDTLGIIFIIIFGLMGLYFIVKGIREWKEGDSANGKGKIILAVVVLVAGTALALFCFEKQAEIDAIYYSNNSYGYSSNSGSGSGYSSSGSFSNKYGTRTTKCAVSGCDNYIAKSGDTNCCTYHSNKCGNCHCYIDGDAMYCMDCLRNALS